MLIFLLALNCFYYSLNLPFLKFKNELNSKNINFDEKNLKSKENDLIDISDYEKLNPNNPNYFYIPIFSTSDIHGHFYPEEYEVKNITYSRGGLDYLAKYVNIIKNEYHNNILYLDAGDIFQGGAE